MLPKILIAFLILTALPIAEAQPEASLLVAQIQQPEQIYQQAHGKLQRFLNEKLSATESVTLLEAIIADYHQLRTQTQEKSWLILMATDIRLLLDALQKKGIQLYQEASSSTDLTARTEDLQLAYQYLLMASQLSGENYLLEPIRGQIAQSLGDFSVALQHYLRALALYQNSPPMLPDPDIAYNHYRISYIQELQQKKPTSEALKTVQAGLNVLHGMASVVEKSGNGDLLQRYRSALETLERRQLDLFLRTPDQRSAALKAYQKALQNYANDYIIHIGYGNLLEQDQQNDAAAAIYKQAIALEPSNGLARLSLGRLYYTQGARLLQLANQSTDRHVKSAYESEAKDFYLEAMPHLDAAMSMPNNRAAILQVLLQITAYLNDLQAYQKYKLQLQQYTQGTNP